MSGGYNNPMQILAFNTAEGWARDVTEEIVREIRDRAEREGVDLSPGLREFIDDEIARAKRFSSLAVRS
jgi:hypothetical protein